MTTPHHPAAHPTFTVPPQALIPIPGQHSALTSLGSTYSALAQEFQGAWDKVKNTKENVFTTWEGAGSQSAQRGFDVALGRAQYAPPALDRASQALYRYAGELAVAQDAQARAIAQIDILQPQYAANPTNMTIEADLRRHVTTSLNAQTQATQAASTFATAISHVTTTQWYAIPPLTARFDAITAAVLDSLVAHHWVSAPDAYLVAQKLETLSASDYQTFQGLEAYATTDAQRGTLYKELAGGMPMTAIVGSANIVSTGPAGPSAPTVPAPPVITKVTPQPITSGVPHRAPRNVTGGTSAGGEFVTAPK